MEIWFTRWGDGQRFQGVVGGASSGVGGSIGSPSPRRRRRSSRRNFCSRRWRSSRPVPSLTPLRRSSCLKKSSSFMRIYRPRSRLLTPNSPRARLLTPTNIWLFLVLILSQFCHVNIREYYWSLLYLWIFLVCNREVLDFFPSVLSFLYMKLGIL